MPPPTQGLLSTVFLARNMGFITAAKGVYTSIEKIQSGTERMAESLGINLSRGIEPPIERIGEGVSDMELSFKKTGGLIGQIGGMTIPRAMDEAILSTSKALIRLEDMTEIYNSLARRGIPDVGDAFVDLARTTAILNSYFELNIDSAAELVSKLRVGMKMSNQEIRNSINELIALSTAMKLPPEVAVQKFPEMVNTIIEQMAGLSDVSKEMVKRYSKDITGIGLLATNILGMHAEEGVKFSIDVFTKTTEMSENIRKLFTGLESELSDITTTIGGRVGDIESIIKAVQKSPLKFFSALIKKFSEVDEKSVVFEGLRTYLSETFGPEMAMLMFQNRDRLAQYISILTDVRASGDELTKYMDKLGDTLENQALMWELLREQGKAFIDAKTLPYTKMYYKVLNNTIGKLISTTTEWLKVTGSEGEKATVLGAIFSGGQIIFGTFIPAILSGIQKTGEFIFAFQNLRNFVSGWNQTAKGATQILGYLKAAITSSTIATTTMTTITNIATVSTSIFSKAMLGLKTAMLAPMKVFPMLKAALLWLSSWVAANIVWLGPVLLAVAGVAAVAGLGYMLIRRKSPKTGITPTVAPVQTESQAQIQAQAYEDVTRTGETQSAMLSTMNQQLRLLLDIKGLLQESFLRLKGEVGVDVSLRGDAARMLNAQLSDMAGRRGLVELSPVTR